MIQSIHIHNFQSHKDTELEFDPGVNVFIGQSDGGKSAIHRAIRWVVENRPLGSEFIRRVRDDCSVIIGVDDNFVQRAKEKNKNYYSISGDEYTAFGQDPPEDVRKELNLKPLNFHNQLDGPFLLSESPGQVATFFNGIAGLSDIDIATKNAASKIKQINQKISQGKQYLIELKHEFSKYKYIDKLDQKVKVLETLQEQNKQWAIKTNQLQKLIEQYQEKKKALDELPDLGSLGRKAKKTREQFSALEKIRGNKDRLEKTLSQAKETQKQLEALPETKEASTTISELLDTHAKQETKRQQAERLEKLLVSIWNTKTDLSKTGKMLENKEAKFHELMPDKCPLCGRSG